MDWSTVIREAVYDRMAGDATLTAMLATYTDGAGDDFPAIFTEDIIPGDARYPFIWSYENDSDKEDGDKMTRGREVVRDISCYRTKDGDAAALEAIAQRVFDLFDRHALAVTGATTIVAACSGPVPALTHETVVGLSVTLRLRLEST